MTLSDIAYESRKHMRIFVTGASGWIGSATVRELLDAGHEVAGLARSDAGAETVAALGADVVRGDITDLDGLRAAASASDGVVHLAYHHDFSQMVEAAVMDRDAIDVLGNALAGSGGPFVIASGVVGLAMGRPATERDLPDPASHPRAANAQTTLDLAARGVRSIVVRFAPTVHGSGDHGFLSRLVEIARETGVSGYVGDGSNRWPAVHRFDAANLVRLVVEDAPAGSVVHAVAEDGVPARDIAEVIGRKLDLPVQSMPAEYFGWLGRFFAADLPTSSELTRELLGWKPTHAGLIEDLDEGSYFE
jgi:nucleoside-diphosphate-sugar epimerase